MKPDIVRRYRHNPILTKAEIPYPVETVHNAAVEGRRSLDKAAYFQAYGFTNARSLDGGIQAWPGKIESTLAGRSVG